ncbi:MAG: prohibitin family protein [Caldilineaceae bacterium]
MVSSSVPIHVFSFDDLLSLIAQISWLLFALYAVLTFILNVRKDGFTLALIRLFSFRVLVPLLLVIGLSLLSASLVFIQPEEVGVVISILVPGGIRPQPLRSGLHFIFPVLENEVKYPTYWQTYTMAGRPNEGQKFGDDSIRARTSDGQEVRLDTSLIFRIDPEQVVELHSDWQSRYVEEFIRPVVRGLVRTQVSQFTVKEVNSSARKDLETTLDRLLHDELADKGLVVDQFILRDIAFTPEYAAAIEHKQVALEGEEQKKHEAQQLRNLAEGQRDQAKTIADGEAAAILTKAKAQTEALQSYAKVLRENPNLITYEYVQKLSPSIRTMLVPNNAPLILPLADMLNAAPSVTMTAASLVTNTLSATPTPLPTLMPTPTTQTGPN